MRTRGLFALHPASPGRGGSAALRLSLPSRGKRGIMLVLVLWMTAILSMMSYSVLYQVTIEMRLGSVRNRALQSEMLARAGLAKAFADLRNDLIFDRHEEREGNPVFDSLADVWADPNQDKMDVELGDGMFNVEVYDAESRFNLNNFRGPNRILLEEIIQKIGYSEEDAELVASAIIDYMDSNETPTVERAEGTEGEFYGRLMAEDRGLSTRRDEFDLAIFPNEPYLTIDALMEVYGVTPDLFFGPGTPEAEYYNRMLGERWGGRFEMDRRRRTRSSDVIVGLRDFFTLDGSGQLNVNTAPPHVLEVLFAAAGDTSAERKVDSLVRRRPGGRPGRRRIDDAFKTIQDFQNASEVGGLIGAMQALHPLTVRSTVFTVRSTGKVGSVTRTLEATVTRDLNAVQVDDNFEARDRARNRTRIREERRARWEDPDNANIVNMPNLRIIRWNPNPVAEATWENERR